MSEMFLDLKLAKDIIIVAAIIVALLFIILKIQEKKILKEINNDLPNAFMIALQKEKQNSMSSQIDKKCKKCRKLYPEDMLNHGLCPECEREINKIIYEFI
jgi:hypothetical protein